MLGLRSTLAPAMAWGPCRFYAQGYCARGDACAYSHEAPVQEGGPKPVRRGEGAWCSTRKRRRRNENNPFQYSLFFLSPHSHPVSKRMSIRASVEP